MVSKKVHEPHVEQESWALADDHDSANTSVQSALELVISEGIRLSRQADEELPMPTELALRNLRIFLEVHLGRLSAPRSDWLPQIGVEPDGGLTAYWQNSARSLFVVFPGTADQPVTFSCRNRVRIDKGKILMPSAYDSGLQMRILEA